MTPLHPALTRREEAVLALFAEGCTVGEVGLALGIADWTVKQHARHACVKLGARNRTAACVIFVELRRTVAAVG